MLRRLSTEPALRCLASSARYAQLQRRYYSNILVADAGEKKNVALVTLNRPKALNALNNATCDELNDALLKIDKDNSKRCIVLTGSQKAFAAGADIKEMKNKTFADVYTDDFFVKWSTVYTIKKPIIAAVSGYALGGGCELAMLCDIILASPTAVFGQPEIKLGVIPGMGGSQRLTRAIGKSRAMELILTGRNFTAQEASDWGLVSRVVGEGEDQVVKEAVKMAEQISSNGRLAIQAAKEATKAAFELSMEQGLVLERRLIHQLFSTADQKEGMAAFAEKRKPNWTHS